jgi:hypothetical protein
MRTAILAILAGAIGAITPPAAASAKCSTRDLAGRWEMIGLHDQGRLRCEITIARGGGYRGPDFPDECALESPGGHAEHWTGSGGRFEVRRDCTVRGQVNFLEDTCTFEGALTRDEDLVTGVGLCENFASDDSFSAMTLSLVRLPERRHHHWRRDRR